MSDINTNEEEGKKNLNFIEAAVEKDLAEDVYKPVSRPSRTDTFTSATRRPFA